MPNLPLSKKKIRSGGLYHINLNKSLLHQVLLRLSVGTWAIFPLQTNYQLQASLLARKNRVPSFLEFPKTEKEINWPRPFHRFWTTNTMLHSQRIISHDGRREAWPSQEVCLIAKGQLHLPLKHQWLGTSSARWVVSPKSAKQSHKTYISHRKSIQVLYHCCGCAAEELRPSREHHQTTQLRHPRVQISQSSPSSACVGHVHNKIRPLRYLTFP